MKVIITTCIIFCLIFAWIFILALLHNSNIKSSDDEFEKLIEDIRRANKKKK